MDAQKAKSIFLSAVEHKSPDEWPSYVADACGDDLSLRYDVELLLAAHHEDVDLADEVRNACNDALPTADQPIPEKPGTIIGPYKLLQRIGEGGFGVVYMADQTEPVKRRVALKIIKPGMDTRQVVARFEAERQALAMMDHPNIARVLGAGTTESGRPYFVMELVKGVSITRFCDDKHLTPRERLELFVQVCQAIQHAHQKGVIHRDIKPSNVLVGEYDDRAVPRIIDFGVAKATEQRLTEKTMFTQFGQIVGTVDYMSPEQAKLNELDIDTRSDIYSLGVLLYELLTGETPIDRQRLRSAAFDEMLRIIREEEPPKPSIRLSSNESLPSIAADRRIERKKLSTLVRGELDWIVMKALDKDRTRRYETAAGFANDVQRYLKDEAVVACPPSVAYRFRKLARRNKAILTAAFVVAMALVVGSVLTAWQAVRARQAEMSLARMHGQEVRLRADAEDERDRAREAARREGIARDSAETAQRAANELAQKEASARREMEHHLYIAHINMAQQAWENESNIPRVLDLLNQHVPRGEQEDLRGFEWYYLRRLCGQALKTPALAAKTQVCSVAFSPDGEWLAASGHDAIVRLWNRETQTVTRTLEGHSETVRSIAFSPDGIILASGSMSNDVKLWNVASGEEIATLKGHGNSIWSVAFSPDGKTLASTGWDASIILWDVDSHELIRTLRGHTRSVFDVAFSPDGKSIVSASNDNTAIIWDVDTGKQRNVLRGHSSWVRSVAVNPVGDLVATGSMDGTVKVWRMDTGQETATYAGHRYEVTTVTFSPDGTTLASGSADNTIRIWDLETRNSRTLRGHGAVIWSVAFSPDGGTLASGSYDRTVRLWEPAAEMERNTIPSSRSARFEFSPDGAYLAAAGKTLELFDVATCEKKHDLATLDWWYRSSELRMSVTPFAFCRDSGLLAVAGDSVRMYDGATFAEQAAIPQRAQSVAFSPDGRVLLAGTVSGKATVWNPLTRQALTSLRGLLPSFSTDGKTMVLGDINGKVSLLDIPTGTERLVIDAHDEMCAGFLSPNGKLLFTGTPFSGTLKLWDTSSAQLLKTIGTGGMIWDVALSSDGRILAMGTGQQVRVLDLSTAEELPPFEGHAGLVCSIAFSPDDKRLVSGSGDSTIRVWDVATRKQLLSLRAGPGRINGLEFSPAGKTIASKNEAEAVIRLWRANLETGNSETTVVRCP